MNAAGLDRALLLNDESSGLQAIIAIDSLALGPACGGIRTQAYSDITYAFRDAAQLAKAMTLKCAIAGLRAGGAKTVVLDHPDMDRKEAFRMLGRHIQDLNGLYRAAGDLGTTAEDLSCIAEHTDYVNTSGQGLGDATGKTVLQGIKAWADWRGTATLSDLTIAIQGCGLIGAGVARGLAAQGANIILSDIDTQRAHQLASEINAAVVSAEDIITVDADILSPCAVGGVITQANVSELKVKAICGGANNQLKDSHVGQLLQEHGIDFIPDILASSGAVITGVCNTITGADPAPFIEGIYATTQTVLSQAHAEKKPTIDIARNIAQARIAQNIT